jgi:hypothetical protein
MAIDPALNTAVKVAINAIQASPGIPATVTLEALAGACQVFNTTCRVVSLAEVVSELQHILAPHPIKEATWTGARWGYLQTEVENIS